ncbi:MAG: hypothetical protein ACLGH8_02225 [Bacteroidia bacterium]
MIAQINSIGDVLVFFQSLYSEGVSAHPDDDFNDYINYETKEPTYTPNEATLRNELMDRSFKVCDEYHVDIYDLMTKVYSVD